MPKPSMDLPPSLEEYRQTLESSILPYISITASPTKTATLRQSKFGGFPYLPKNTKYPTSSKGDPLLLLVQLNFDEIPQLENYPEKGILQIYISGSTEMMTEVWGLQLDAIIDSSQKDFRVLYFPEIEQDDNLLQTNFDFLEKYVKTNKTSIPIGNGLETYQLNFELKQSAVPPSDFRFEKFFAEDTEKVRNAIVETKTFLIDAAIGHKIGGYAYNIQGDPRYDMEEDYLLLFQMDDDSNASNDILWGDGGVANFYIHQRDLMALDFTKVGYYWDNH